MKNISVLFILLQVFFVGCKTTKPVSEIRTGVKQGTQAVSEQALPAINFSDQSTWLLGYFDPDKLTRAPYSDWYIKGFDEYMFNSDAVNKLFDINKDDLIIKIIMGTWCPDSRREVPEFMRILYIWKFPLSKVKFIGVDNTKHSPVAEYDSLNIQRVPTFIIYKKNIEAGRIIENPVTSLEQDMLNILTSNE
jgi:hypothetical protein